MTAERSVRVLILADAQHAAIYAADDTAPYVACAAAP